MDCTHGIIATIALALAPQATLQAANATKPTRPNVVFILADDFGYGSAGCYPGDDVVDWWAIDMFEADHMRMKKTQEFMAAALEHRRPVMIGESSPKGMRTAKGAKIWDAWFETYFHFIHRHKNVKAFCYINQDWDAIGTWKGWGDSRLSQNAEIWKKFQEQIGAPMFLHGADREQTLKALRVKE